jgi:ribosomal protein L40E
MDEKKDNKPMENTVFMSHNETKPKKCPNCGHLNPHNRTECRKCKTPLGENLAIVNCPECGNEVKPDDTKCSFCGLPIEEVRVRARYTYSVEKKGPQS